MEQPLYGVQGQGFFVSSRCFTHYIKLTFFRGAELEPLPPVEFKDPNERALHIHEDDDLDEQQLTSWFAAQTMSRFRPTSQPTIAMSRP